MPGQPAVDEGRRGKLPSRLTVLTNFNGGWAIAACFGHDYVFYVCESEWGAFGNLKAVI